MNSLKVHATSETSENVKFEKVSHGGRNQLHWRTKNEVDKVNRKTEGEGDHMPQSLHPGKYIILRRAQDDMVMMPPQDGARNQYVLRLSHPERRMPSPLLVDTLCEVPEQIPNIGSR